MKRRAALSTLTWGAVEASSDAAARSPAGLGVGAAAIRHWTRPLRGGGDAKKERVYSSRRPAGRNSQRDQKGVFYAREENAPRRDRARGKGGGRAREGERSYAKNREFPKRQQRRAFDRPRGRCSEADRGAVSRGASRVRHPDGRGYARGGREKGADGQGGRASGTRADAWRGALRPAARRAGGV